MKSNKRKQERGQAIIMVTLSMTLICGMLGLVVDLGWGFFVKRSAQSAADAAALAAVRKSYSAIGQQGTYNCATNVDCQASAVSCSSITNSSNLYNGCQYARQNFKIQQSSQQNLRMTSGTSSPFATATGNVTTKYWVTATVAGQIPQLFSAVLGNTKLT